MGGGSGGIIVGGGDFIDAVFQRIDLVAQFRRARLTALHTLYQKDENLLTPADQEFVLRCGSDILDQAGP
jgi:hypothetical protein